MKKNKLEQFNEIIKRLDKIIELLENPKIIKVLEDEGIKFEK